MNSNDYDVEFFDEPLVTEILNAVGSPNYTDMGRQIGEMQHAMAVFSCFNENSNRRPVATLLEKYKYDEQNIRDFEHEFEDFPETYGARVHRFLMSRRYSRTR